MLNLRLCAKELECAQSRFTGEAFPTYEVMAKEAAKEASQLHQMIFLLTELYNQPANEPFNILAP